MVLAVGGQVWRRLEREREREREMDRERERPSNAKPRTIYRSRNEK